MSRTRAGYLSCLCIEAPPGDDFVAGTRPSVLQLAAGFALAVLAQALTASILPLAGAQLAPSAPFAALPLALMFVGAILATFPAALLLDRFGRRAAFALGASLGLAGGLVLAFALVTRQFPILCLGAFWLGTAQGFGLFYRHAAVIGASPSASAWVLSAGALAGLAAPWLTRISESLAEPYFLVGAALAAAAVQILGLALAANLREPPVAIHRDVAAAESSFRPAVLIGGAAWLLMAAAMQGGPVAMLACTGSIGAATGLVAWHVLAMYGSSALVPLIAGRLGWTSTGVVALGLAAPAAAFIGLSSSPAVIFIAMLAVGAGWGIGFGAATLGLYRSAPSPVRLAAFDALMLAAALAGVFVPALLQSAG